MAGWELGWGARVRDWEPSRGAPLRCVFVTVQLCEGLPVRRLCFPGVTQGTGCHCRHQDESFRDYGQSELRA